MMKPLLDDVAGMISRLEDGMTQCEQTKALADCRALLCRCYREIYIERQQRAAQAEVAEDRRAALREEQMG